MKVLTSRFGELEIEERDIIEFKEGLFGFEEYHKYLLIAGEENSPFKWLQCVEFGDLAFIVINPMEFKYNYVLDISEEDVKYVKLEKPEDVEIYAIVVVPKSNPSEMTANLQGPVIINTKNHMGKQIISTNPSHKLKHYILKEMQSSLKEISKTTKKKKPPKGKTDQGGK